MRELARLYSYLADVDLPIRAVLLVPFPQRGKFIGTVWAIRHHVPRLFDAEQQRMMEGLTTFAAAILDARSRRPGQNV